MLRSLVKDISKHHFHYLILMLGLSVGFFGFFIFNGVRFWQILISVYLSLFYFSWGVLHHILEHDWHLKILLEYLLVSIIGCMLLLSLIFR